jgi:hypothetical protein
MATVTKASDASVDTITAMKADHLAGNLYAGEALAACDFCYIKASDGKVYRTNATSSGTEATRLAGVTPVAVAINNAVTLLGVPLRMRYAASGLTPGAIFYLSATAPGGLDTAATTGDAVGVAQAIDDTDVRVTRNI